MRHVVDQHYFRRPELRDHLLSSKDHEVIVTDMAFFEMLKGSEPISTAKRSLAIISEFPEQVFFSNGSGHLMRQEIAAKIPIIDPIDYKLTEEMRDLLREVRKFHTGARSTFPLNEELIRERRERALSERLDHSFHKQMLDGSVDVLRKQLPPQLQKAIRKGKLTPEVYRFAYQTGFLAFQNAVNEYGLSIEAVQSLYLSYSFAARHTMTYQLSCMRWFEAGGSHSMHPEDITRDLHDIDYVVHSTYFDGVLSEERTVNILRQRVKDFFEINLVSLGSKVSE